MDARRAEVAGGVRCYYRLIIARKLKPCNALRDFFSAAAQTSKVVRIKNVKYSSHQGGTQTFCDESVDRVDVSRYLMANSSQCAHREGARRKGSPRYSASQIEIWSGCRQRATLPRWNKKQHPRRPTRSPIS
jgi:hypothetical protein